MCKSKYENIYVTQHLFSFHSTWLRFNAYCFCTSPDRLL